MTLTLIDWLIVAAALIVCFVPALFFGAPRRAGARRSSSRPDAPCRGGSPGSRWSRPPSAATRPNLVTDIVRRNGVAGNWVWWAFVLTGVATVFFYARLWRRSGVMTDLEFYEIRYSGTAASVVRGFRAVYLGLLFNCMIMATVNLAACKIAGDPVRPRALADARSASALLNVAFAAHSGLWGVLVIDMIQFFIKMTAVIAAAYFALQAPQVGGLHGAHRQAVGDARARRRRLPRRPARLHEQLGPRGRGVHHADRGAVVGGLVSRRGAGRRQLHRAADAGVEIGAGRARRRAVLQRRALRAAAVAVDPRRARLAPRLSRALGHPARVPESRSAACSGTTSPIPRCSSSCRSASSA